MSFNRTYHTPAVIWHPQVSCIFHRSSWLCWHLHLGLQMRMSKPIQAPWLHGSCVNFCSTRKSDWHDAAAPLRLGSHHSPRGVELWCHLIRYSTGDDRVVRIKQDSQQISQLAILSQVSWCQDVSRKKHWKSEPLCPQIRLWLVQDRQYPVKTCENSCESGMSYGDPTYKITFCNLIYFIMLDTTCRQRHPDPHIIDYTNKSRIYSRAFSKISKFFSTS